jgi:RNA-directed DNA polymerase
VVRYADDFVVTGDSKELLETVVKPWVEQFLRERGLILSKEKTKIVHIDEGFDFVGWNFRKYRGKMLIKPSKKNVKAFYDKVKSIIERSLSVPTAVLINKLNPVFRGWAEYHKGVVAKATFSKHRSTGFAGDCCDGDCGDILVTDIVKWVEDRTTGNILAHAGNLSGVHAKPRR